MTSTAYYFCSCGATRTDTWGPLTVTGLKPWQVGFVALPPTCHVCGKTMARKDPRDEGTEPRVSA